jgi:hypothetical protein
MPILNESGIALAGAPETVEIHNIIKRLSIDMRIFASVARIAA